MKFIFLTCFIGVCMLCTAQVKKKDQGFYKGVIPGYSINTGQELIKVDSCELYIKIEKTRITIRIDDKEYQGLYKVDKREKRNILLKPKLIIPISKKKLYCSERIKQ